MEAQTTAAPMLYALLQDEFDEPRAAGLEIVDLAKKAPVRELSLGPRNVTSLAVAPRGRLYVVDVRNTEVAVYDTQGDQTGAVRLASAPRDCVLSHDGTRLYVSTREALVVVDTAEDRVAATQPTGADDLQGIAVSPDDELVGAAARDDAGDASLYLFEAATLKPTRVPITDREQPGSLEPSDVAFTDTGRAILWDGASDSFFQVDVTARAQDPAGTARLERDHGTSVNFNNVVAYSPRSKRAYAQKEREGTDGSPGVLAVLDVAGAKAHTVGGFAAQPFVLALAPDGRKLYVSSIRRWTGGGGDLLDEYDVETDSFDRRVYTFQRDDMSVRDMTIL